MNPTLTAEDLPQAADYSRFEPFLRGVFSQWHPAGFELKGHKYGCAEQWMMVAKARLFEDVARAEAILATADPGEQKRHGQAVAKFDTAIWDRWKVDIVFRGNLAKFGQNQGALRQLRGTAGAMLVEANPRDWIWGAGVAIGDPRVADPAQWPGENLLGRILVKVRDQLV